MTISAMDLNKIGNLAETLRQSKQKDRILSLSTDVLSLLNTQMDLAFEHCRPTNNVSLQSEASHKSGLLQNLHYLQQHFQQCTLLKLVGDGKSTNDLVDITRLSSVTALEFTQLALRRLRGLQKVRCHLKKLVCRRLCNTTIDDIFIKCGNDDSQASCWNELKEVAVTNCGLTHVNECFEYTPWLCLLDLSHNHLTDISCLSCLQHLKYLNVSYNKLESLPEFSGPICTQLQTLHAKGNFLEDISGLQSLHQLYVLDLSSNCLLDIRCLLCLSHMATLQWLSLCQNPLNFHPNQRALVASYLHANVSECPFILNNTPLETQHKRLIGSVYPRRRSLSHTISHSLSGSPSFSSLCNDRHRKVRKVKILEPTCNEESGDDVLESLSLSPPEMGVDFESSINSQHLETKRQIEDLREQFGESWLQESSISNVLGLSTSFPSISAIEHTSDKLVGLNDTECSDVAQTIHIKDTYNKGLDTTADCVTELDLLYGTSNEPNGINVPDLTPADEPVPEEWRGEESSYVVTSVDDHEQVFVAIADSHICEKEVFSGKKRHQWDVKSLKQCTHLEPSDRDIAVGIGRVQLDFDMLRRDKQRRIYEMAVEELHKFLGDVAAMMNRHPRTIQLVGYECIKCSTKFSVNTDHILISERIGIYCPKCDSNMIVKTGTIDS